MAAATVSDSSKRSTKAQKSALALYHRALLSFSGLLKFDREA